MPKVKAVGDLCKIVVFRDEFKNPDLKINKTAFCIFKACLKLFLVGLNSDSLELDIHRNKEKGVSFPFKPASGVV